MTWSKVLIYLINTAASTYLFFYISTNKLDLKIACGLYACYVLVYMFSSDFISGFDSKTAANILKKEKDLLCNKIDNYKNCMKEAHHSAVSCLTPGKKATEIRYEMQILVKVLSDVVFEEKESSNDYTPAMKEAKGKRVDSAEVNVFETLSAGKKKI